MSEKRRSCIDSILDKEFQYHYFLLTNVQLHISLRMIGGNLMDIQLVIVSLIVLAAVGYMVWRAKKARKGQSKVIIWGIRSDKRMINAYCFV